MGEVRTLLKTRVVRDSCKFAPSHAFCITQLDSCYKAIDLQGELMSIDSEVQEIIAQLQGLQAQQTALISRLGRLCKPGDQGPAAPPQRPAAAREFAIGDRVRIWNPRALQETRGRIARIGARITVTTPKGNTTAVFNCFKAQFVSTLKQLLKPPFCQLRSLR